MSLGRILVGAVAWRAVWALALPPLWHADSPGYTRTGVAMLRGMWYAYDGARPPVYSVLVGLLNGRLAGITAGALASVAVLGTVCWLGVVALVWHTVRRLHPARWRADAAAAFLALLSPVTTWETTLSPFALSAFLVALGAYLLTRRRVGWAGLALAAAALTRAELAILLPLWALAAWRVWVPVLAGWVAVVWATTGAATLTTLGGLNTACAVYDLWDASPSPVGPVLARAHAAQPWRRDTVADAAVMNEAMKALGTSTLAEFSTAIGRASVDLALAHPAGWARNALEGVAVVGDLSMAVADRRGLDRSAPTVRRWPSLVSGWPRWEGAAVSAVWLAALVRRGRFVGGALAVVVALAAVAHVSPRYLVPLLPAVVIAAVVGRR